MKTQCLALGVASLLLLGGCATPRGAEATRNLVLQYLGGDVGTAGPFGQGGKKELTILTEAERKEAESLIDRGAVMFLVYGGSVAARNNPDAGASRVVLVQDGKILRDYIVQPKG